MVFEPEWKSPKKWRNKIVKIYGHYDQISLFSAFNFYTEHIIIFNFYTILILSGHHVMSEVSGNILSSILHFQTPSTVLKLVMKFALLHEASRFYDDKILPITISRVFGLSF